MRAYIVHYKVIEASEEKEITFLAKNKTLALHEAKTKIIPRIEGKAPASVYVHSVICLNCIKKILKNN